MRRLIALSMLVLGIITIVGLGEARAQGPYLIRYGGNGFREAYAPPGSPRETGTYTWAVWYAGTYSSWNRYTTAANAIWTPLFACTNTVAYHQSAVSRMVGPERLQADAFILASGHFVGQGHSWRKWDGSGLSFTGVPLDPRQCNP